MRSFFTKKRSLVALAAVAVLAIAGGAYAYFSSSASQTSNATVGSTTANSSWNETITPVSANPALYPTPKGSGPSDGFQFTLNNTTPGSLGLENLTIAVAQNTAGDVETTAGSTASAVTGCKASWFSVDGTGNPSDSTPWSNITVSNNATPFTSVPVDVAAGKSVTGTATLQLIDQTSTNQDACQGATPAITISTVNGGTGTH